MSLLVNPPQEWGHFESPGDQVRPNVNMIDNGDEFIIEVMAPGMRHQDFGISIRNNRLWIEGYHNDHHIKNKKFVQREFPHELIQFRRSFELDEDIDTNHYTTSYKQGIFKIVFGRQAQNPQSKNYNRFKSN